MIHRRLPVRLMPNGAVFTVRDQLGCYGSYTTWKKCGTQESPETCVRLPGGLPGKHNSWIPVGEYCAAWLPDQAFRIVRVEQ